MDRLSDKELQSLIFECGLVPNPTHAGRPCRSNKVPDSGPAASWDCKTATVKGGCSNAKDMSIDRRKAAHASWSWLDGRKPVSRKHWITFRRHLGQTKIWGNGHSGYAESSTSDVRCSGVRGPRYVFFTRRKSFGRNHPEQSSCLCVGLRPGGPASTLAPTEHLI